MTKAKSKVSGKRNSEPKAYSVTIHSASDFMRSRAGFGNTPSQMGRDLYDQFGYNRAPTFKDYLEMYQRNPVANRLIRAFPKATWRKPPQVRDDAEKQDTPFTDSFMTFADKMRLFWHIERADRLASIGTFAILVFGFADGKEMHEPLEIVTGEKIPVAYMASYAEGSIENIEFDNDVTSKRYGKPVMYTVTTGKGSEATDTKFTVPSKQIRIHHSRLIHIAETIDEDPLFGVPRLKSVFNALMDIEKVSGASAENFWLCANRGLIISSNPDMKFSDADKSAMRQQAADYKNQLSRIITGTGITVTSLGSDVPDPSPNLDKLYQLVSAGGEIPTRILTGSEAGQLASSQDENNWSARIDERKENYATPAVLVPVVNLLVATGNIEAPATDYWVQWEMGESLSEAAKADIALKKMQAVQAYTASPLIETIVTPGELREMIGLDGEDLPDIGELPPMPDDKADALAYFKGLQKRRNKALKVKA